jgi:isopenicillin-N epimerase
MPGPLATHWMLDPSIHFMNHGSFGACPRPVLAAQQRYRDELEHEPVTFLVRTYAERMERARTRLAEFVGADPDGIAFVPNATAGANTVLRSLRFRPGDEILCTNFGYPAATNAARFAALGSEAVVRTLELPLPVERPGQVVDRVLGALTERSRLVLIDHVTSLTGLILPIEPIVEELTRRGVLSLVDGAHGVGMLPLSLSGLGATFYTSNCHKWLCSPKGSAFLHVSPEFRGAIHPLAISHGFGLTEGASFRREFDWTGTADPTPFLCIPDAIDFLANLLPGGWPAVREANRTLAREARHLLCKLPGTRPVGPEEMLGSLAAVTLPDADGPPEIGPYGPVDPLQGRLFTEHRCEVLLAPFPRWPRRILRVSAQLYNDLGDYEALVEALRRDLPASVTAPSSSS